MKSKKEIIEETVAYIQANGRAVELYVGTTRTTCKYLTKDNKMCAVGRCLIDPESAPTGTVVRFFPRLDSLLKPEYRGHPLVFWTDLQRLHDTTAHWDVCDGETRLSEEGKKWVDSCLELYE